MSTNEFYELIKNVAANIIKQYSTPLITLTADPKTPDVASGTFVTIGGIEGILTCAHCIDPCEKKELNFVRIWDTEEDLIALQFEFIIKLPHKDSGECDVDVAFIVLQEEASRKVKSLGKLFWDLDKTRTLCDLDLSSNKSIVWVINGNVVYEKPYFQPSAKHSSKQVLYFKNAGFYFTGPDLAKTSFNRCVYPEIPASFRVDYLYCEIKKMNAKKMGGISGAGLWQFIIDSEGNPSGLLLFGIATEASVENYLICRGPVTLYSSFYSFCLKNIYIQKTFFNYRRVISDSDTGAGT